MNADQLLGIVTRCVECGTGTMIAADGGLCCDHCGHRYRFNDDGVLVALSTRGQRGLPTFYDSAFYHRWLAAWEDMVERGWVIYERPLYRAFSLSGHRNVRALLAKLPTPPRLVVDLGCGDGKLRSVLPAGGYVGVDINAAFLGRLKAGFPDALAIQADFNELPFATGGLECCVSAHVLEHLYLLAEGLEEVRRVLRPDGAFVFAIPTEGGLGWELGRRLVTGPRLRRDYDLDVAQVMAIEHVNDARRVMQFVRLYFGIEQTHYAPLPLLPLLAVNSSISVVARPLPANHELVRPHQVATIA